MDRITNFLLDHFITHKINAVRDLYKLEDTEESPTTEELLEEIAIKRGCLKGKGEVDFQRVSRILLKDFRDGRLGRVSFETPVESF